MATKWGAWRLRLFRADRSGLGAECGHLPCLGITLNAMASTDAPSSPKGQRIMALVEWYPPAFEAGGPIRSVHNLMQLLKASILAHKSNETSLKTSSPSSVICGSSSGSVCLQSSFDAPVSFGVLATLIADRSWTL